jgi:hypothetical protein
MADTVAGLLARLLDQGYERVAGPVLNSIAAGLSSGDVRNRMQALEAEARRLADAGQRLRADNPVLRQAVSAVQAALDQQAALLGRTAESLALGALDASQLGAVELAALMARDPVLAQAALASWNRVSAEAMRAVVELVENPAWAAQLGGVGDLTRRQIDQMVVRGFVSGTNPLRVARDLRKLAQELPIGTLNTSLRTLYLQSYRRASAAVFDANRGLIRRTVRLASLDSRVCPVCAALHGTEIPIGEPVEAHYQCRCVAVAELYASPMQLGPTGEEWFEGLPLATQREMLGDKAYNAYQGGRLTLMDLVGRRADDLYGTLLYTRSVREVLGGR